MIPENRHLRVVALLLAMAMALVSSAIATEVEYQSPEILGAESSLVVRGEVSAVRTLWNDAHTRILTEVTVNVAESYKGSGPAQVRLVQMGGELDNMRMTVAGSLVWDTGEDVVLFLQDSLPGRYRVAGFSQGKYRVRRDAKTGEEFVQQAGLSGIELSGSPAARTSASPDRMSLRRLLGRALPSIYEGE